MTTSRRHVLSIWVVAVMFLASLLPVLGHAQEATPTPAPQPPAFVLEPVGQDGAYFTVEMEPGASQELTVAFGNGGTAPVSALTYVADAYTLVNGGFGVRTADDPATGPTTWIDFPTETYDLQPGEGIEQTFTVTVPEGTAPGQYIAGLAIQTADPVAVGDSEMLLQIIKKTIAIFIIVPGPEAPALEIGDARVVQGTGTNSIAIDVHNAGNVFLNPEGTVSMTTAEGEQVLTSPISMGTVYAGDETTLEIYVPTVLEPGDYVVSIDLADEDTGTSASATEVPVTVAQASAATPMAEQVVISSVTLDPITGGDGDQLQALNVVVSLDNPGQAIPSARLTLHVSRDGELVEDYPLNSSLVVQAGTTEIQQRYIPLGAWEPGTYSFALTLEAVDPTSGQVTVLATLDVEDTIVVP